MIFNRYYAKLSMYHETNACLILSRDIFWTNNTWYSFSPTLNSTNKCFVCLLWFICFFFVFENDRVNETRRKKKCFICYSFLIVMWIFLFYFLATYLSIVFFMSTFPIKRFSNTKYVFVFSVSIKIFWYFFR